MSRVAPEIIKNGDDMGCWGLSLFWGKTLYSKRSVINRKTKLSVHFFERYKLLSPDNNQTFLFNLTLNKKCNISYHLCFFRQKKMPQKRHSSRLVHLTQSKARMLFIVQTSVID
ncbi:hypothetical protein A145_20080 [Vibrio splendidus 5S-101]|nr:hypothetical protein A145_20080 [Vibrio splendidus 5S-101]